MYTHLHPKANFLHKQAQDLFSLKYGKSITRSDYDHGSGTFTSGRTIEPRDFIVLSGLHPFYLPISRKVIDLKVYLDTADALRCHWKVLRDSEERGYSREQVLAQLEKRADDAKKYIAPQREYADVTVTYFTETAFDPGDRATTPDLKLKITLSSSIHVEQLLKRLDDQRIDVYWDYSDDLTHQYLVIGTPPAGATVRQIAYDLVPNVHELITADTRWQEGYRGFVQLVLLLVVSEMIREEGGEHDV
jgi:uridine kinase